jgi:hypothetical protein
MNREITRISPIPIVHKRTQANLSSSGGYYAGKPNVKYTANQIPDGLLIIDSLDKHVISEGFGATGSRKIPTIPPLLAHNSQFVRPVDPEPIPVEHQAVQTEEPVLFKKELESLHEYQEWISQNIDPLLKVVASPPSSHHHSQDLRLALIQNKPDDIGEFLRAYGHAMATKSDLPRTIERDEYMREHK